MNAASDTAQATEEKAATWGVHEYAAAKGLDESMLRKHFGVEDGTDYGEPCVRIPWRNQDGTTFRWRVRLAPDADGKKRERWAAVGDGYEADPDERDGKESKSNRLIPLYGCNLVDWRKARSVILCEGESDVQALLQMGIDAVGVPGASTFSETQAAFLKSHPGVTVYVHDEDDHGGEVFVARVHELMGGNLNVFRTCIADPSSKDPCDLLTKYGVEGARAKLTEALNWCEIISEGTDEELTAVDKARAQPIESISELMADPPKLRPELVHGRFREAGRWLITGELKGGKTQLLVMIALACSNSGPLLGCKTEPCDVLFVVTEDDRAEMVRRFLDVAAATGWTGERIHMLDLLGKTAPLDVLKPVIIEKALSIDGCKMIVLDSIYTLESTGKEDSEDMRTLTDAFREINDETGCGIVYTHHHSKAAQNYTSAYNRGSGSNFLPRNATTVLDLSPVSVKKHHREERKNVEECRHINTYLAERGLTVECGDKTRKQCDLYRIECRRQLETPVMNQLIEELNAIDRKIDHAKGWRMEWTLRGYEEPFASEWWFEYPLFVPDDTGILAKSKTVDNGDGTSRRHEKDQARKNELMARAGEACEKDGVPVTRDNMRDRIGKFEGKEVTKDQLKRWTGKASAAWSEWQCDGGQQGLVVKVVPVGDDEQAEQAEQESFDFSDGTDKGCD